MKNQKRLITERQEQVLKLCHHDFRGMTQEEAAKIMGITRRAVCFLLERVKKVLPQYFPILTKHEAKIYHYYMVEGWDVSEIADYFELEERTIYYALERAVEKGMRPTTPKNRILSYDELIEKYGIDWVDSQVKHQF